MKLKQYSAEFQEQALAKVLGRARGVSVDSVALSLNMSKGTLGNWVRKSMLEQKPAQLSGRRACDWAPANRLLALHESHGLEEEALNAWYRGIFAHDLS